MFLGEDQNGNKAWHVALCTDNLDSLNKMWELAKEVVIPDKLSNKVLLA